jgi:hypothetical protein
LSCLWFLCEEEGEKSWFCCLWFLCILVLILSGCCYFGFEFVFEFFISDLGRSRILISIWVLSF